MISLDSSLCGFLFYHLCYYDGCQDVKKLTLIAVCVVEFSGLHSDFLVCKLQFYTVNFTVLFCKRFYSFSVVFTKMIQCVIKKGITTYLFTILSANPKMYVRRHEAQQKIIFQFIVHRCKIRIIALTESLKETDFTFVNP